jgi:hypothetical protein
MKEDDASTLKTVSAFLVIIVGLIIVAVLAMKLPVSTENWKPSEISALIGGLTTFLGSVVGAFLGVQVGAAGKDKAEAARAKAETDKDKAQETAKLALAALQPEEARRVLQK